jgi:hypothetical protein
MLNWENSWNNCEYEKHIAGDENQLNKHGCDSFVDYYKESSSKIDFVKLINEK